MSIGRKNKDIFDVLHKRIGENLVVLTDVCSYYSYSILWINTLVIFEIKLLSKNSSNRQTCYCSMCQYVCMYAVCVLLITQLSACICKSFHMYIHTSLTDYSQKDMYILTQYVVLTPPLKNCPSSRLNTVPYGLGSSVEYTCIHTHAGKCKHIATWICQWGRLT